MPSLISWLHFCCKCSHDIQQEAIYIQPPELSFKYEKVYLLLYSGQLKREKNSQLQNVEGKKGISDLQITSFLLHH